MWVDEFHCHLRILEVKTGISVSFIFIHKWVWLQRGGCLPLLLNLSPICSPGMALFSGILKSEKEGSAGRLVCAPAGWYVPVLRQLDFWQNKSDRPPGKDRSSRLWVGFSQTLGQGPRLCVVFIPGGFQDLTVKGPEPPDTPLMC